MNENIEFNDDQESSSTIWLAFWCNEGLERLVNVSKFIARSKNELVEKIKSGEGPIISSEQELTSIISSMTLRGRFNPQRHYELYTFNSNDGMDENTIREWFDSAPQLAVDWIRANGYGILKKTTSKSTKPIID